jgi:peroxiredoxin
LLTAFIGCYSGSHPARIGSNAPDFTVQDSDHSVTLSKYRGQVVVLNFWATWCPPCVDEAPSLNALQKRIAPLGGTVLGVSVDDDQEAYQEFIKHYELSFPTFRDTTKQIPLMYGTTMYPDTYVIDRKGKLDRKIVGPQDWSSPEMTQYLDKLLAAK